MVGPMTDLSKRLKAESVPDRELDADIACALHEGIGHDAPPDNTTARNGKFCHGSQPGNYDVHVLSGL